MPFSLLLHSNMFRVSNILRVTSKCVYQWYTGNIFSFIFGECNQALFPTNSHFPIKTKLCAVFDQKCHGQNYQLLGDGSAPACYGRSLGSNPDVAQRYQIQQSSCRPQKICTKLSTFLHISQILYTRPTCYSLES